MQMVFRNTLLMCIKAFPQFPQFDVTKSDLDSWYDWYWGKDIAGRSPPPSDLTILLSERNAWREIHNSMFEGKTLKEAMTDVRNDTLFWQREVYERMLRSSLSRPKGKGQGDPKGGKAKSWQKGAKTRYTPVYTLIYQPQWDKSHKGAGGKGAGKTKKGSKGKGKSKEGQNWPKHWAKLCPRGLAFCVEFHVKRTCPGQCGRSHNCPVQQGTWVCNAQASDHTPENCPLLQ